MGRWAAAMADVAATGGGGLRGRVAVVVVVVTGHLVVTREGDTQICVVLTLLRVLVCLGTFLWEDYCVCLSQC